MKVDLTEKASDQIRGTRSKFPPLCDEDLIDFKERYDELLSALENSIRAKTHPDVQIKMHFC